MRRRGGASGDASRSPQALQNLAGSGFDVPHDAHACTEAVSSTRATAVKPTGGTAWFRGEDRASSPHTLTCMSSCALRRRSELDKFPMVCRALTGFPALTFAHRLSWTDEGRFSVSSRHSSRSRPSPDARLVVDPPQVPARFADNASMDRRRVRLPVFSTSALGMSIFVGVPGAELRVRADADWHIAAWLAALCIRAPGLT